MEIIFILTAQLIFTSIVSYIYGWPAFLGGVTGSAFHFAFIF